MINRMRGKRKPSENDSFGGVRSNVLIVVALAFSPVLAQTPPATSSGVEIKQTYAKLCAGCHGADAHGTQQGPGLVGNPSVRRRSIQNLRNVIRNGIPAAGMPAFDLSVWHNRCSRKLGRFAECLGCRERQCPATARPASSSFLARDNAPPATWSSWRRVRRSAPICRRVAREMTVDQLREAFFSPVNESHPATGWSLPDCAMGDHAARIRAEQNPLRYRRAGPEGPFHPLSLDQVSRMTEEKQSFMRSIKAAGEEVQNLIAFLSGLTGVQPGAPISPRPRTGRNRFLQQS